MWLRALVLQPGQKKKKTQIPVKAAGREREISDGCGVGAGANAPVLILAGNRIRFPGSDANTLLKTFPLTHPRSLW